MRKRSLLAAGVIALAAGAQGCLPDETRPPPGELTVSATAGTTAPTELATMDGWTIELQRILMSLGYVSLSRDDDCDTYADANYGRILDFGAAGPQRVGAVYAVGDCEVGFRVAEPASNAVLGEGVSEGDRHFMRIQGSDPYTSESRVTLYVSGSAEKDGVTKTFAWSFRRALVYEDCQLGTGETSISLASDDRRSLDILIRARALFQTDLDDQSAELRFEPFARADDEVGDGDGDVTLGELGALPLGELGKASGAWAVDTSKWTSFRDFLYLGLAPTVPRFDATGRCSYRTGSPDKGMGGPLH